MLDRLEALSTQASSVSSSAALLALAKRGGRRAASLVLAVDPIAVAHVGTRRAALLARGLLGVGEARLFWRYLDNEAQSTESASAALAVSLALLRDEAPAWTLEDEVIERVLQVAEAQGQPAERAEVFFARAANAWRHQRGEAFWRKVWERVVAKKTEPELAVAGGQALLATGQGPWLDAAARLVGGKSITEVPGPALALAVLRVAERGTPPCVDMAGAWLRQGSRRPTPSERADPRPYAVVGLLRALRDGRIKDADARKAAVHALQRAAKDVLREGDFRQTLTDLLERHAAAMESGVGGVHPAGLRRLVRLAPDPYGYFMDDLRDAVINRLNDHLHSVFQLSVIRSAKESDRTKYQGERYLHKFLVRFPYFQRVDLLSDRGKRLPLELRDAEDLELNR